MGCVRSEKFLYWEKSRQKNGEIHSSTSFSYLVFILLVLYVVGSKVAHTEKLDTFSFLHCKKKMSSFCLEKRGKLIANIVLNSNAYEKSC